MKKFLLLAALASSSLLASAQAEPAYTIQFGSDYNSKGVSSYASEWYVTCEATQWDIVNFNNNNNAWSAARCGSKSAASVAKITSNATIAKPLESVAIDVTRMQTGANDKVTSASLATYTTLDGEAVETVSIDLSEFNALAKNGTATLTAILENPAEGLYYQLSFDIPKTTNNGVLQINKVVYYAAQTGPEKADPEISFDETDYTAILGEAFVSPKATTVSDGAVTYSCSDTSVATVDEETGEVTLIAAGTCIVYASVASTDTYKYGQASYTLTVIDPSIAFTSALGVDFTFEEAVGDVNPWNHDATYGLKGTGYVNGSNVDTTGIAASPVVDLTNFTEPVLNFSAAYNQFKEDGANITDTSVLSDFCELVAKVEGGSWTVLNNALTFPASQSWAYVANDPVSLDAYAGKKMQFGFRYTSTSETAGTWEIKAISVTGKAASAVESVEVLANEVPAYYTLQGVRVAQPTNGLYIEVKGGKSRKIMK